MEAGRRQGDALVRARIFARLSPVGWGNLLSDLQDMLIFTPFDLKSIPLSELHLVTSPGARGEMPRELQNAAHACHKGSDQSVDIRPFSGARPIP